jgi:hypothetical protein
MLIETQLDELDMNLLTNINTSLSWGWFDWKNPTTQNLNGEKSSTNKASVIKFMNRYYFYLSPDLRLEFWPAPEKNVYNPFWHPSPPNSAK